MFAMKSLLVVLHTVVLILYYYSSLAAADETNETVDDDESSNKILYYDILVYGANSAGVAAAVTGSKGGKYSVIVMENLHMIGGMAAAGGVSLMNQGGCGLSGLAYQWNINVGKYYNLSTGMPSYPPFPRMKESELAFWDLLRYPNSTIDVTLGCHVINVHKQQQQQRQEEQQGGGESYISQVDFLCDDDNNNNKKKKRRNKKKIIKKIRSRYVIDSSYDGDIMVMAGVDYTSGRESQSVYNESLAGVQIKEWSTIESFKRQNLSSSIDPYDDNGNLLKYINPKPMSDQQGSGDDKLMSYEYFVCLTTTPKNILPFNKAPKGYNPKDFELLLRQTKAAMNHGFPNGPPLSWFGDVQCYDPIVEKITGNKDCCFCCGTAPVNTDQPGLNEGWASANYTTRQKMAMAYKYYIKGSLYFLANDVRVPEYTRNDTNRYGYCRDEYEEFGNFPPQLYVRISNRLIGQSLLTQNNITNPRVKKDAVAMGCWVFDQHTMDRVIVKGNNNNNKVEIRNEGFFRAEVSERGLHCNHPDAKCGTLSMSSSSSSSSSSASCKNCGVSGVFPWYDVPFGVMVPAKRQQAYNLLVPVCISASSVAYSSARIENMFMDLGSAAGVAIANLLDEQQQIAYDDDCDGGGGEETTTTTTFATSSSRQCCPKLAVQDVNITAVQDILSRVYKQKFHGPLISSPKASTVS